MIRLMATRFNNATWGENLRWRERNADEGCIYSSPVYIKTDIPLLIPMFVIEMNNETNDIMGIGLITNRVHVDRRYKIYSDQNYNRFTYRGKRRIDKDELKALKERDPEAKARLEGLEARIFKTKKHLKRGHGISQVPLEVATEYLKFIQGLFKGGYPPFNPPLAG